MLPAPRRDFAYPKSDFQDIASNLRPTDQHYPCAPASPITYNPVMETITLIGCSESNVIKARKDLELLVETFSRRWGRKYLMTSHSPRSRARPLDSPSPRSSTNSETTRVFPIHPKESRRLVRLWLMFILPALPHILNERLGGNYAASLVRRGQSEFEAEPCIQIESPCLPAQGGKRIIQKSLDDICIKHGHASISLRFTEGTVKKLNGEGAVDDDDGKSADDQLAFNYGRPYSKPGMGASVGLLCSNSISATLGGYVLIGGKKYLLTSEHFVAKSRKLGIGDCDIDDDSTLTSPSIYDLKKIEANLKQNQRDLEGEINELMLQTYGNQEIAEEAFNDLTPALRDKTKRRDDVRILLDQVTKPPLQYAVGTVRRLRLDETRTEVISRSLADDVGLQNDQLMVKHHMDWALFDTYAQMAEIGENRHKYRSNQDAIVDNYIEESDHVNQPGDVCQETCGVVSGLSVHYVGQRSKHRSGKVSLPSLVREGSSEKLAWGFLGPDGYTIPYSDVAGDSGAWVIRTDNNKLMGQVHSYGQDTVLFTPIDVVFAALREACGSDVTLPPSSFDAGLFSSVPPFLPLCSEPGTPPVRPYRFLKTPLVALNAPLEILATGTGFPEMKTPESSIEVNNASDSQITDGQVSSDSSCDSPSPLPSLTESPPSLATTPEDPKSPLSLSSDDADSLIGQVDIEKMSSKSLLTIVGEPTMSEIPDLSLDQQAQPISLGTYAFHFNNQSLFPKRSGSRVSTWPVGLDSKATRARRGFGTSLRHHAKPISARPLFEKVAVFGRIIGK